MFIGTVILWLSAANLGVALLDMTSSDMQDTDEARLMRYLLDGYHKESRPINGRNNTTEVKLTMMLSQIISVSEKNEEMMTSIFMIHNWSDPRLTWNMSEYGGINVHRLPADSIWTPRIILENSVDGEFDISLNVETLVYYNGKVEWMPPSLYKSFCRIEVQLFPFDWQNCSMVFRSPTYEADELRVSIQNTSYPYISIDPAAFQPNGEWDIISKPITTQVTEKGGSLYSRMIFHFILLRRPQFYIMNLIIPCILMSMFSCFTFFLPAFSGEKMTLSVSVLLGETVFLFLIAQRMPETSLSVPLLGLYLIFSMALVIICVVFSVIVCNVHFRSSTTHIMPKWAKTIFIDFLAPVMKVERPPPSSPWQLALQRRRERIEESRKALKIENTTWRAPSEMLFDKQAKRYGFRSRHVQDRHGFTEVLTAENGAVDPSSIPAALVPVPKELRPAVDGVNFIAGHVKEEEIRAQVADDWAYFALILDRLFFWIYFSTFVLGTVAFFLRVASSDYPDADMS